MEFSGFDDTLNARRLAALERGAAEYLREPVGPRRCASVVRLAADACDDMPISAGPGRDGIWLATGHGMMGIGMSTGTGQLIADLVTGRAPADRSGALRALALRIA
jgi:D-amino-acid dehydrogenase